MAQLTEVIIFIKAPSKAITRVDIRKTKNGARWAKQVKHGGPRTSDNRKNYALLAKLVA